MLADLESSLYSSERPKSLSKVLGFEQTINDFCAALIVRFFNQVNIPSTRIDIYESITQLNILHKYEKMFSLFIEVLENADLIERKDGTFTFTNKVNSFLSVAQLLEKIRLFYPKFYFFFSFLDRCSQSYPLVLSGRQSPSEILFPKDNPSILKKIYDSTPKLGHEELYLLLAKEFLLKQLPTDGKLLEIGAGQGLLTQLLLPEFYNILSSYHFTDIGNSFLIDARRQWGTTYPMLSTTVFDITNKPDTQNIPCNHFDALVGFNVVHATPNISETLENLMATLKKGGMICLIENVKKQVWIDMIYGLTDGWWLFNDSIRKNSPLLTIPEWKMVLDDFECESYTIAPSDQIKSEETDTALIIIHK